MLSMAICRSILWIAHNLIILWLTFGLLFTGISRNGANISAHKSSYIFIICSGFIPVSEYSQCVWLLKQCTEKKTQCVLRTQKYSADHSGSHLYPRRRLKQEGCKLEAKKEFQARLGHVGRPCLQQQQQKAKGTRRGEDRGQKEEKEEGVNWNMYRSIVYSVSKSKPAVEPALRWRHCKQGSYCYNKVAILTKEPKVLVSEHDLDLSYYPKGLVSLIFNKK